MQFISHRSAADRKDNDNEKNIYNKVQETKNKQK